VISLLALEKGGFGVISASLKAGQWLERYSLHGDSTSLVLNAFSKLSLVDQESERSWQETYDSSWKTTLEGRGFSGQVEHFFQCLKTRQQPHTSAWDSVKTQRLVEAMVAKLDA
jgi:virulence factor